MSRVTGGDDWTEGAVESNGIRLHYTRTGGREGSEREGSDASTRDDGPPLVVAHGVYDDGPCRTPLLGELGEEYDVVAYDARGHGRSDAPESGYGLQDRVDDLVGLIDGLDISNPILFGHSMGGDTVAAAAARYPDLPRACVLVDPACLLGHEADDEYDPEAAAANARERIEWWHDHTKEGLLEADDELRGHVEAGDAELASLVADARLRVSPNVAAVFEAGWLDAAEAFASIEAPALVLRADGDEERREHDRTVADELSNGRLVHVDDAGHCVFRDQRGSATAELRAFLDGV